MQIVPASLAILPARLVLVLVNKYYYFEKRFIDIFFVKELLHLA